MSCTAPVRGHRSPRAWSRCPVCRGGGGWSSPSSSYARPVSQGGLPTPTGSSGRPAAPPTSSGSHPGGRSEAVERALISAGLDAVASRNFTAALVDVAVALQSEASRRGKTSHWLCELLADAADAIDPGSVASAVGDVFADALVAYGVPNWAASIAGWGVAKASEAAIGSLMPSTQLCLGLRVLALLVCPSPETCPAGSRLSVPILKASLSAS